MEDGREADAGAGEEGVLVASRFDAGELLVEDKFMEVVELEMILDIELFN